MCKRYFFILFVLKICTFRFANYNKGVSTRKSSIFSSDLTLSSPQAFDDHLRRCCSKITHTSFLTHRHIDLNSFTLLQYKVTLLHTWHSSPSIDKWKLRSTRKWQMRQPRRQVSVKPPVHARHASERHPDR